MRAPTPPGYCVDGPTMSVMFVSGHQEDLGWHNAEYVIGWKMVLKTILSVFETYTRMEDIKETMKILLSAWAKNTWMGRGKDIMINIHVTEEDFLPFNIKQIKIQFFDELKTLLRFYVKRKPVKLSRSLKQLTLRNLSFLIDKPVSTEHLELPKNLTDDLRDELENCWKSRYILDAQTKTGLSKRRSLVFNDDRRHAWKARYFDINS